MARGPLQNVSHGATRRAPGQWSPRPSPVEPAAANRGRLNTWGLDTRRLAAETGARGVAWPLTHGYRAGPRGWTEDRTREGGVGRRPTWRLERGPRRHGAGQFTMPPTSEHRSVESDAPAGAAGRWRKTRGPRTGPCRYSCPILGGGAYVCEAIRMQRTAQRPGWMTRGMTGGWLLDRSRDRVLEGIQPPFRKALSRTPGYSHAKC